VPEPACLVPYEPKNFKVTYVSGKSGLTAQRNQALAHALDQSDVITFFDDDFLPANDYLNRLETAVAEHPDWVVIMGWPLHDGACGAGLTFEEGLALIESAASDPVPAFVSDHLGAYGCNMSVRTLAIGNIRFDERLVLYGWQEDIDFTSQLRRHGRIVCLGALRGVHLGVKTGRVNGIRLGYSQIANPLYLLRKGTVPASFACNLMCRNLAANLYKSLWPEPYVDRWGRLKGNLLAAFHAVRGKIEPEYILKL